MRCLPGICLLLAKGLLNPFSRPPKTLPLSPVNYSFFCDCQDGSSSSKKLFFDLDEKKFWYRQDDAVSSELEIAIRIKLMVFDCFDGDCCSCAENGFDAGGAWNLRGGASESEDDLSVILRTSEVLQKF